MTRGTSFSLAVASLIVYSLTLRADVIIGLPAIVNNGNCIPFGCPGSYPITTYQEDYTSTAFPGPVTITGIDFFNTEFIGGVPAAGTYDFSLSYTSKPVGALDLTNPANNITSGSQAFFGGSLPGLSGGMLDFTGTPFSYDPLSVISCSLLRFPAALMDRRFCILTRLRHNLKRASPSLARFRGGILRED